MKSIIIRIFPVLAGIIFLTGITGCKNKTPEVTIPGKISTDSCVSDQSISYKIYIPSHPKSCSKFPLFFILDPHGAADAAISRFIPIAEQYGCALVSTYSIKNNIPDYIPITQQVITDVRSKFPVGAMLYLAGFSGGARMSIAYAQQNTVNGLVVCGALASDEEIRNCKTKVFAIAGMVDFNFGESARFVLNPNQMPDNLFLEINNEVHEWPSPTALGRAFGAIFLSNPPEDHDCFPIKELTKDYLESCKKYNDSLIADKDLIKTSLEWHNLQHLDLSKTGSDFAERLDTLLKNSLYRNQISQVQKSLQFEYRVREAYQQALMKNDAAWWQKELKVLNDQIERETNNYQQLALKRIKAFLGIMCYTLSRNSIQQNDKINTPRFLVIYKLVDPENPDMFYFSALFAQKSGEKADKVTALLQQSIDAGYTDMRSIQVNFPIQITSQLKN